MNEVEWTKDNMIEVNLKEPDDFLKVRETLTRIGVASRKERKLYQSCHILHKKGQYYIVHFKELFALDGKKANLSDNDVQRRNRIIKLLSDWGLVEIVKETELKYNKKKKDETQNKKIENKKNAYSIVVGTFKYRNNAEKQIKLIKSKYPVSTKDKISNVVLIKVSGKQLYESRFENFSKKEAYTACKRLKKYNRDCFVRL